MSGDAAPAGVVADALLSGVGHVAVALLKDFGEKRTPRGSFGAQCPGRGLRVHSKELPAEP